MPHLVMGILFLDVPQDIQLDYALLMRNLVNANTKKSTIINKHLLEIFCKCKKYFLS